MEYRKKLIEVALPLEAINEASAKEKSIRNGHPSTLHLWWSRKPLATARAVLFASLVDDPSSHPETFPTEEKQNAERNRLFSIIEDLVQWENSNNERILSIARDEIKKSVEGDLPPFLDPFCGGGTIPLEAQRLGLKPYASDLNPIAVLINKAMIEIPSRFSNIDPINPASINELNVAGSFKGSFGIAQDVRYYGRKIKEYAERKIGHLYPKVSINTNNRIKEFPVVAWLFCRYVRCPNPACSAHMPLLSKYWLSTKLGNEAWVEPVFDDRNKTMKFIVKTGKPDAATSKNNSFGTSFINQNGKKVKATFKCIFCNEGIAKGDYIDSEANTNGLGIYPLAIVAAGNRKKQYVTFDQVQENTALVDAVSFLKSDSELINLLPNEPSRGTFASNAQGRHYGFKTFSDYFTRRQLLSITTFCQIISSIRSEIENDATHSTLHKDNISLENGGNGTTAYVDAIITYLSFALDRLVNRMSSICIWNIARDTVEQTFSRNGIQMTWDFAEANVLGESTGSWLGSLEWIPKTLENLISTPAGVAYQHDASQAHLNVQMPVISTDPPYYDNICYSDLSDFFYIWLRRTLGKVYPSLFTTMLVPKSEELIASAYRFDGDKRKAQDFFEKGLGEAFNRILEVANPHFPFTVYYAFKQSDPEDNLADESLISSTGWETMLSGLIKSGFTITGTWPTRTERGGGLRNLNQNALASSIVLVCRVRDRNAVITTRRELINNLRKQLPAELRKLQQGNIAPVDLAQASIGPGMSIYSSYSKVLEADGTQMSVRTALQIINQELDAYLVSQEGEMDTETRFCVSWYEQFGLSEAAFGEADVLSRAKNTAVERLVDVGVLSAVKGKVRLLKREEFVDNFDFVSYRKDMIWLIMQNLVKSIETEGEEKTAEKVVKMRNESSERAKDLAYRLYTIAERKGWTEEALAYNSLVVAWPDIQKKAAGLSTRPYEQQKMY